jgi:hypothetical protein
MRQILSFVLALLGATLLVPTAFSAESVASQIVALPLGTRVELHLKNKQKMRGTTGAVSDTGFKLVGGSAGGQQIAFDDVASVQPITSTKWNATKIVLIGVGVAAVVTGIVIAVALHDWKTHPFGSI